MAELGTSGAVAFGKRAVVLRRRPGAHVFGIGCGEGFGGRRQPCGQCRRQLGAGVGCSHGSSLPVRERVPLPRVSCVRACARPRASCAGAVRTPDCARETEGAPLPPVSQGVFRKWRRSAAQRRRSGSGCPFSRSHHTPFFPGSSPKREQKSKISEIVHNYPRCRLWSAIPRRRLAAGGPHASCVAPTRPRESGGRGDGGRAALCLKRQGNMRPAHGKHDRT